MRSGLGLVGRPVVGVAGQLRLLRRTLLLHLVPLLNGLEPLTVGVPGAESGRVVQDGNTDQLVDDKSRVDQVHLLLRVPAGESVDDLEDDTLEVRNRHKDLGTPELPCRVESCQVGVEVLSHLDLEEVVDSDRTSEEAESIHKAVPEWARRHQSGFSAGCVEGSRRVPGHVHDGLVEGDEGADNRAHHETGHTNSGHVPQHPHQSLDPVADVARETLPGGVLEPQQSQLSEAVQRPRLVQVRGTEVGLVELHLDFDVDGEVAAQILLEDREMTGVLEVVHEALPHAQHALECHDGVNHRQHDNLE
eukprot:Hpha_TRINITY_DN15705_c2_g5::TRINITY_DN15705_c2_g5_i1::g.42077::m.42077